MAEKKVNANIIRQMKTNEGDSLGDLSDETTVFLVFLRHFGCTFCREALADIAKRRSNIEEKGIKLVFVHMTDHETAERYFDKYNLEGVPHVSDPECRFYQAFGLVKGNFTQLFGLQSWIRGFQVGVMEGHGVGPMLGDGFQMPGIFVIKDHKVKDSFIHKLASDRPDYDQLLEQCCEVE